MPGELPHARRLALVDEAFRTLPERYLGAPEDFDATYHVRLGDLGRTWEVRCTTHGARVRQGCTRREPDVVIGTHAETWLALREGELSGVEAFWQRLLYARGDVACPTAARRCCASTTSHSPAGGCRRSPWATAPTWSASTGWARPRPRSSTPPGR